MRLVFALLACAAVATAQGQGHRRANPTTLGLVVFESGGKVVVHEALEGSPAAKAGVLAGDVVVKVGPQEVQRHNDIDSALREWPKEKKIELDLVRKGKKLSVLALPAPGISHPYLKAASRERTGFEAPAWHAFAWVNVKKGAEPPTRANTLGKVVVIHCFQSW